MRTVRPMTIEEQEFAERNHDLAFDFLRFRSLPAEEYYDIIIFGYLAAVQQFIRTPPAGVPFRAMAIRAMKDCLAGDREYRARAMRLGFIGSLEELDAYRNDAIPDPSQDTHRQVERKALLEQAAGVATPKEIPIVRLLIDGFALSEAARALNISRSAAKARMRDFYARARIAIG